MNELVVRVRALVGSSYIGARIPATWSMMSPFKRCRKRDPEDFEPGNTSIFRLNYYTSLALCIICGWNWGSYLSGSLVRCLSTDRHAPPDIDELCWLHFSSSDHPRLPGGEDVKHSRRYLWIPSFFLFQGIVVLLPRVLRDVINKFDGAPQALVKRLSGAKRETGQGEETTDQGIVEAAADDFLSSLNAREGISWAFNFSEALNFVTVLGNLIWIASYLGFSVSEFQARVDYYVSGTSWDNSSSYTNPFQKVFPRSLECTIPVPGPNKTTVDYTSRCSVRLNGTNELVFVILWIWYIFLLVLGALLLLNRLWQRCDRKYTAALLGTRVKGGNVEMVGVVKVISERCKYGDAWLLYVVGGRADPFLFKDFLRVVARKFVEAEQDDVEMNGHVALIVGANDAEAGL